MGSLLHGVSRWIMRTYDINEAADFLKVDRSTALDLANVGSLPGAKVGRAWVFMEDELVAYLRDITRKQTQARRANAEAAQCLEQSRARTQTATAEPPSTGARTTRAWQPDRFRVGSSSASVPGDLCDR